MSLFGLPMILFEPSEPKNDFLIPDKKWSNTTGKVFDVEDPTA